MFCSLALVLVALANYVFASRKLPSFTPPDFAPSTIENDGTSAGRYDVRQTMVLVDENLDVTNNYYFVGFITTTSGRKFECVLHGQLIGSTISGGILGLADLYTAKQVGATFVAPGSGSTTSLALRSSRLNITSPPGSDNITDLSFISDYAEVTMDLKLHPTGYHMYYGGSGGWQISDGFDFAAKVRGWAWYWANPHMRIQGSFKVDGQTLRVDTAHSFGMFEREWGSFNCDAGYNAFWLYLSNGIMIQSYVIGPNANGSGRVIIATIWHPDGVHEILEVDNTTSTSDPWVSPATGYIYHNSFFLSLHHGVGKFSLKKAVKESELHLLNNNIPGFNISESFAQGTGTWKGNKVDIFGHIEELRPQIQH